MLKCISPTLKFFLSATRGAAAALASLHLSSPLDAFALSGFGDNCSTFAATACDGPSSDKNRPFLFNLVGNMQQRPWRQRLRVSVLNSSLPVASPMSSSAVGAATAAAAADLQLTEHMVALQGQQQHFAIVYVTLTSTTHITQLIKLLFAVTRRAALAAACLATHTSGFYSAGKCELQPRVCDSNAGMRVGS
jgi:hypothetical protein